MPRSAARRTIDAPTEARGGLQPRVQARGDWLRIGQDGSPSKSISSFVELLLNLSETTVPDRSPVISISD